MVVCMFSARQRASSRHAAPRRYRSALVLAVACTALAGTAGTVAVVGADAPETVQAQAGNLAGVSGRAIGSVDRDRLAASRNDRASRTAKRITLEPQATSRKFATARLNIWTAPREQGKHLGLVPWAGPVAVTGQVVGHWAEILVKGDRVRWVNADYLANRKPRPERPSASGGGSSEETTGSSGSSDGTTSGISGAPCPDGSAVESGLTPGAVRLYRAVCAAFPMLTTYGGYDAHGEHVDGRAIDFMVSGSAGQAVADWVLANAGPLGIRDIIYAQRIWTPEQASAGWRYMSDRGSATANHYDHVHVAVF